MFSILSSSSSGAKHNFAPQFLVIPLILFFVYYYIIHLKFIAGHHNKYRNIYKNEIIGGMAKLLHSEIDYHPQRGISVSTFKESGLYSNRIDKYQCEDLFSGKIGKTQLLFSEVHAKEKKKRRDSDGKTKTYWETIFRGLFFIADFHKDFHGWLTIKPDFAESSFGWLGRKIQSFNPNLIRLESPEFEKAFVVHGSDDIEARYILTPDMQERILSLRHQFGRDIRLSLHHSQLNLTIPNKEDLFEPNMKFPANDLSQMQRFINQMSHFFNIVEMLNLNTRIWSKK